MTGRKTTNMTTANARSAQPKGWVPFVGSGPANSVLRTARASALLAEADVVITEIAEHASFVRRLLGLPEPRVDEDGAVDVDAPTAGPEFVDGGFGEDGQPLTHASRAKVVV